MRFLVQPAPESLERARPPVRVFLAFSVLLILAAVASRAAHGALTPAGLEQILEAVPGERLGPVALWEEVHQGAFLYGFLLLALGSLLAVCPVSRYPGFPGWAALRIGAFLVATCALLAMAGLAFATFGREGRPSDG
jgi:hypothetical protein